MSVRIGAVYLTRLLEGQKVKQLVPADAAAKRAAVLILLQRRTRLSVPVGEEVIGVQVVVAKELEQ
jgi:hypothetical protein